MTNAVSALMGAIWRTMQSPKWAGALGDDEARTLLMAAAVATALGGGPAPTLAALQRELDRAERDEKIRDQRRAKVPWSALAARHNLSTRQVRRIVDADSNASADVPPRMDNRHDA